MAIRFSLKISRNILPIFLLIFPLFFGQNSFGSVFRNSSHGSNQNPSLVTEAVGFIEEGEIDSFGPDGLQDDEHFIRDQFGVLDVTGDQLGDVIQCGRFAALSIARHGIRNGTPRNAVWFDHQFMVRYFSRQAIMRYPNNPRFQNWFLNYAIAVLESALQNYHDNGMVEFTEKEQKECKFQ
jgi:hypothetical protein